MRNADSARAVHSLPADSLPRLLVFLGVLIFGALLESWKLSALRDPEIWGRLRVGAWILQNQAWPDSGLFSQSANLPWRDFSWGFDVIVVMAYRIAGYAALPALLILLRIALALCAFRLAGGWRNFWPAAALSAIAQYVLLSLGPGPAFISALLFAWEACVLWEVRSSGEVQRLIALPVLFWLWANLDTGFIYGLVLYALFLIACLLETHMPAVSRASLDRGVADVALPRAVWIAVACLGASCLNPYGAHPYGAFFAAEFNSVNHHLLHYSAMGFRQATDYVLMLLGMAAFLALGLLRSRDLFQIAALAGCAALSFHAQREGWLLTLAAVAVVGQAIRWVKPASVPWAPQWNARRVAALVAAIGLSVGLFFLEKGRKQDLLFAEITKNFPVGAADFLRQHAQPAPLFNEYQWGAFLTWYLPEYPVVIDARHGLYPEEAETSYFKAMNADIPYREYSPMNQSPTLLMDKSTLMGQALRGVAGFQVIYEDDLAILYSHAGKERP